MRLLPVLAVLLSATVGGAADAEPRASIPATFYKLKAEVALPGRSPDWDYLALDSKRQHLFIARRGAGLFVFDTARQRLIGRIADSEGAGATLIVPVLDRGFSTNEDGTTTVFDLATLKTVRRVKFADDGDAATYDTRTGRIAFVSADSRTVTLFDPIGLKNIETVKIDAKKADGSATDGSGHLFLNERDRNAVLRIDMASGEVTAEWPTKGCDQPTGMAIDAADGRAFIGCRGAKPVILVMDLSNGRVIATLPLGRGNDGVVYDALRRRVIATNGIEANIVVYRQEVADTYRLEQAVTTRPNARTMAYNSQRDQIFTVTAQGVVDPSKPVNSGPSQFYPNNYYDESFEVLTYSPGGR